MGLRLLGLLVLSEAHVELKAPSPSLCLVLLPDRRSCLLQGPVGVLIIEMGPEASGFLSAAHSWAAVQLDAFVAEKAGVHLASADVLLDPGFGDQLLMVPAPPVLVLALSKMLPASTDQLFFAIRARPF